MAHGCVAKPGELGEREKCSPSDVNSHRPCLEIFVTSVAKVVAPGIDDLPVMLLDDQLDLTKLLPAQIVIVGNFNLGLQPNLASPSPQ